MDFSTRELAAVLVTLTEYSERDLAGVPEADLIRVKDLALLLKRLAEVPAAVVGAEVARRSGPAGSGGFARRHGARNPADLLSRGAGGSTAQAHDLINAGGLLGGGDDAEGGSAGGGDGAGQEQLGGTPRPKELPRPKPKPRFPHLAEAFRTGAIGSQAAALIERTLKAMEGVDEATEERLVRRGTQVNLSDLRLICQRALAAWDVGKWAAREKRLHEDRYVTLSESTDGTTTLHGKLDPSTAAHLKAWLAAQVKAAFQQRAELGLGRAPAGEAGRIRADALAALARHGMRCTAPGSGVSTTVTVRLDEQALKTGLGLGDCDDLATPITASTLRRMAADAQLIPIVLGSAGQPLDVGYARRSFTPAQRLALAERDGGCAYCHAPVAWCDAHHIDWWSRDNGPTNLSNGVLLCVACHHRIHDDGWQVHATATEVWFTPPASVDPGRRPRQGGKKALDLASAEAPPGAA